MVINSEIKNIMETNEGYGSSISSVPDTEENVDDVGPEYWEDYFAGPDDSEIEAITEELDEDDALDEDECSEEVFCDVASPADGVGEDYWKALLEERAKVSDIVAWLEKSKLANLIDNGREGFFVRRGVQVIFNNEVIEGLDWLLSLGLGTKITNLGNYMIIFIGSDFPASERLWFLKTSHVIPRDLATLVVGLHELYD